MREALLQVGSSETVWGMDLKSVAPWLIEEIKLEFLVNGDANLVDQVEKLWVQSYRLHGNRSLMDFKIYPVPFPSVEDLKKVWPLKDERKISIGVRDGEVTFSLDCFGYVQWITVKDVPELYEDLEKHYQFYDGATPTWTPIEH
jgi:hypothetical protein